MEAKADGGRTGMKKSLVRRQRKPAIEQNGSAGPGTKPGAKTSVRAPVDRIELRPLRELIPYASNPRLHSADQVTQIAASMREFGQTQLVVIDESGEIIAGHGRVMAAQKLEWEALKVGIAVGWSAEQKRGYRIADNALALSASWDMPLLAAEFHDLKQAGFEVGLIGFDLEAIGQLELLHSEGGEAEDVRGRLLHRVDVTIKDPDHVVEHGDHYVLDGRHHLICVGVIAEWKLWLSLLADGSLFCPYPGVFVPFCQKAKDHSLVMVQPDPYIAGHILDRVEQLHGKKAIRKQ